MELKEKVPNFDAKELKVHLGNARKAGKYRKTSIDRQALSSYSKGSELIFTVFGGNKCIIKASQSISSKVERGLVLGGAFRINLSSSQFC